jgi:hypothetical protein
MVTVVYTLGKGSHYNNAELKFSLRSVEKNLINVKNIVIVGEDPKFKNMEVIRAKDDNSYIPDNNIFKKLLLACTSDLVTDKFLFMNDDHFILDSFDAEEFPYLYSSTLDTYVKKSKSKGMYYNRVVATHKVCPYGKFYDVHTPILYEKAKFLELEKLYDYDTGMVIKSLYGNTFNVGGEEITDCKRVDPPIYDKSFLSTFPRVTAAMFRYIEERFPERSKYETNIVR